MDFSTFALYPFGIALEEVPDPRSKVYSKQGPLLDDRIPLPAQWIKICGKNIFSISKKQGLDVNGGKFQVRKQDGFSLVRWQFWKKRFREISTFDQASEETRQLSLQTAELMENIEFLESS
jgi:hypothetical protein